ncbi:MAG: FprA family A-type flavoprotein [Ruminococcaceae bacterium]|nr:FprA family A-type flavoprotein [Oscillospiraceae bacterium]
MHKDIIYIGVNDHDIDLFEGQYDVPNGMAYNSYIINDEKVAVFDTVDARFVDKWLENIKAAIGEKCPDYLIVQHMEPDHSSGIAAFTKAYPDATVVASDKAFVMMNKFFSVDFTERKLAVKDGDTLSLGTHTLSFVAAPMVHWPEVIMTYDSTAKALFSADGFGKFGALDVDEDWACEARRYYFGIVGKYGAQVQAVLKKASGLEIETICPLHGPILDENLGYYLDLYNTWSSYGVESEGVVICYTSVYGNTKKAALMLADELEALGCAKVAVNDLARCDMAEAVEDAFRYGKIVLATTTYNGEIFPFMRTFLSELAERGYKKRKVGIIENGSWAPVAARIIKKALEECKEITFADTTVTIHSGVKDENIEQIKALAKEML